MRPLKLSLLLSCALLVLVSHSARAQDKASPLVLKISSESDLPMVYPYHGKLLNHDLSEIPPTPENVLVLFRAYWKALAKTLPEAVRADYGTLRQQAETTMEGNAEAALLLEASFIYSALEKTSPEQRSRYQAVFRAIEGWAGFAADATGERAKLSGDSRMQSLIRQLGLAPKVVKSGDPADYMARCKAAKVPIPPPWGSARWLDRGVLDGKFVFAGEPNEITQIYAYADKTVKGACMALARRDGSTLEIQSLGFICQSRITGKACFWDKIDQESGKRLTGAAAENLLLERLRNGSNLGENCTNCHRGENAFILHPDTKLDISSKFDLEPKVRYEPISGQATWGNPGPMIKMGERPCARCHEIPELREDNNTNPVMPSAFCQVIRQAAEKTMPYIESPAGWASLRSKYAAHIDLIRERCAQ